MVRKKIKKVSKAALICGTVVVALNVIGIGYASWNDSISMGSTISTGKVDMVFSEAYFNNNPNGGKEYIGKGGETATFEDTENGENDQYVEEIENEQDNGYNEDSGNGRDAKGQEVDVNEEDVNKEDAGDKVDIGNKKYNDIKLDFDSKTILIHGTMYYANDIVLKYEVVNDGTIPADICNENEMRYEFENGGFIIIKPISSTIIIHIPKVDSDYYVAAPIEFEARYGSWKETLYIELNITVELDKNNRNMQVIETTTPSALSIEASGGITLNNEEVKEGDVEVTTLQEKTVEILEDNSQPLEDAQIEKINEILDNLSDAIIVEPKPNNYMNNE